jgi:hypothetical protein
LNSCVNIGIFKAFTSFREFILAKLVKGVLVKDDTAPEGDNASQDTHPPG